jgi:hypothetical protein
MTRFAKIPRRVFAAIALCGVAPVVMADDLLQTLPSLWVPAAALSLTLVTAAGRSKR